MMIMPLKRFLGQFLIFHDPRLIMKNGKVLNPKWIFIDLHWMFLINKIIEI